MDAIISLSHPMNTRSAVSATSKLSNVVDFTTDDNLIQCPTCEIKLRSCEVAQHCEQEMERLRQMKSDDVLTAIGNSENDDSTTSSNMKTNSNETEHNGPWFVYQRVRKNRRTRMKLRKHKSITFTEQTCPVCNTNFPMNEIEVHVDKCLNRNNQLVNGTTANSDENSSNDEDGFLRSDEYEEYEWAGQKRIRVSTLLQGGYASLGIGQTTRNYGGVSGNSGNNTRHNHNQDEEDEDLNVDEDDTRFYGPTQYDENDVITPGMTLNHDQDSDVTSYMRRLITGSTFSDITSSTTIAVASVSEETSFIPDESFVNESTTSKSNTPAHYQQIIDSLKAKLRYHESPTSGKYKCLICLDDYRNPAISVACWHVHCEECWLRTLGARKLCPQCNLITTPKDLRRIYM